MVVVLDADALIKLNLAGVLKQVARAYECLIPDEVYHEVVTRGKERGYSDAQVIERTVQASIVVRPTHIMTMPEVGLGAGERAILALVEQQPQPGELIVVTDDARFLTLLDQQGVDALIPSDLIVVLAHRGCLTKDEARGALERLRPSIRQTAYRRAVQALEEGREQ